MPIGTLIRKIGRQSQLKMLALMSKPPTIGPKDAANGVVTTSRRDTGDKTTIKIDELATGVAAALETMQKEMLARATKEYDEHRKQVTNWTEIVPILNGKNVVLIAHCLDGECADLVKDETAAIAKSEAPADDKAPSMGAKGEFRPLRRLYLHSC